MKTSIKVLLMALVTIAAGVFSQSGLPTTTVAWEVTGMTVLGSFLIYVAKNAIIPSTSVGGTINWMDIVSGLIMALGTGLSNWAASAITSTPIVWTELLKAMGVVVIGYFAKTFFAKPDPTVPKP
jgi:hypothetical protein